MSLMIAEVDLRHFLVGAHNAGALRNVLLFIFLSFLTLM